MQRVHYACWYLPACNHTAQHPFTHSFILAAYTCVHFPGVWTSVVDAGKKRNDLRTTVLNLILSSPLKRLSLGLWDCPVGTLHERILLNLVPVVSHYCPTHFPPLILHAFIVLACFCLRLQLYSFVFYRSLATCVSPCLYLTILSGTQGVGTGDGRRRFAGTFLSL